MNKLFKWLMVMFIPLLGVALTSCSDDKDEPDIKQAKTTYTFNQTQHFSKKWMVAEIKNASGGVYTFEYDSENRPVKIYYSNKDYSTTSCSYSYTDSTSILNPTSAYDVYTGYFEGNKMVKAIWGYKPYIITNVIYEGNHLIKGSNGYTLTWDAKGNIATYSDLGMKFTYNDIPNRANVDFNMFPMAPGCLEDCWDDDGSDDFTIFGWTGARTADLIEKATQRNGDFDEYTYEVDKLGRVISIRRTNEESRTYLYTITYLED